MSRYVDLDKLTWKAVMVRDVAVPIYLKDEVDRAAVQEVAPVVHAHWIKCADFTFMCPFCCSIAPYDSNEYGDVTWAEEYPYCPYCGAKMDEGKGEEK